MSDHSKCYSCKRFLKECIPQHDIGTQECKSFLAKSSVVEEINLSLKKIKEEEDLGSYWCSHCKRRTTATVRFGEIKAVLVCPRCGSSDIEGYEDDKNFNPSER